MNYLSSINHLSEYKNKIDNDSKVPYYSCK